MQVEASKWVEIISNAAPSSLFMTALYNAQEKSPPREH
jgi:hypothetical protein